MLHLPSLLLVDGDIELSRRFASTLERAGLAATAVANGEHACNELERNPFDLVLVELELPDMSALGLLRCLRRASVEVPFAGFGGTPDVDTIVQLMRHGAVDYLPKPLRVDVVEAAVDRAAQLARRAADMRNGAPLGAVASSLSSSASGSFDSATRSSPSGSLSLPSGGTPAADWGHQAAAPQPTTPLQDPRHRVVRSSAPARRYSSAARRAVSAAPAAPPAEPESVIKRLTRRLREGDIELPAIAPIAGQVQQMMARPDVDVDEIVTLLGSDQSITVGVLRLANSGRYGTARPVTDLHEAVVRVGNKRALALAHQVVLSTLYAVDVPPLAGMMSAMWRNTIVTANGARELANLLGMDDAEAEFVAGMVHNVGELALIRILAEMPDRLEPGEVGLKAVAELLHAAHEDFGRAVLKRWGMPARFTRVAGAHHHPPVGPEDRVSLHRRQLVLLAWSMAIERGFRYLPDQEPGDIGRLCHDLGLVVAEVEDLFVNANEW